MHECRVVDESFLSSAKVRASAARELAVSAAQLFACFEDNASWCQWVPVIRHAAWTSALPVRQGSTRRVSLVGGVTLDEEFWAWQPERRIGFRVTAASTRTIAALLECFDIAPVGERRCKLHWRMGAELRGPWRLIEPAMRATLAPSMHRMLGQLEHVAARYPMAP